MKIVLLVDNIVTGGGAGVIAWNHAQALILLGHDVSIITTTQVYSGQAVEKSQKEGVNIYTLYTQYRPVFRAYISLNNIQVISSVKKILKDLQPDIVHAHNIHQYLSYESLALAKRYSKGLFVTLHDSMSFHYSKLFPDTVDVDGCTVKSYKVSPLKQVQLFKFQYNPLRNFLIRRYLKLPDKIFAVSGALAEALSHNGINNVEVVHNGIDVDEWKSQEIENYVFFGGRLSRAKGGDVLVGAMKNVLNVRPETKLLLVGDVDAYTRELARKIGENNVVLAGPQTRENMKHMYARSSLIVAPSLCFDWFPTVILEAMASGKPVIATCFGGAKEMVRDGETGYIINPQNEKEFSDKILDILDNPLKAKSFGSAGFERVKKDFSMSRHIEKLVTWYDTVVKK